MAAQRSARARKVGTGKGRVPEKGRTPAKVGSAARAKPAVRSKRSTRAADPAKGKKSRAAARPAARGPGKALERVRKICAAWPETTEKEAWGTPTFRVRDKMFAMYAEDHHGDGRVAIWCKAGLGVQEALVATDSTSFFVPPYVGVKGWLGVRLDLDVDWDEIGDILADAYQMTAPPKLAAALGPKASVP
jgi:hypothetical protein